MNSLRKIKVFLDANVWIAGAGSPTGGSRQILDWAERKLIKIVTSRYVLQEASNNVAEKLPRAVPTFGTIIKVVKPRVVRPPSKRAITQAAKVIDSKDAPVLAAAIAAKTDYLITLDRKHFKIQEVEQSVSFPIVLPGEFVVKLRPKIDRIQGEW